MGAPFQGSFWASLFGDHFGLRGDLMIYTIKNMMEIMDMLLTCGSTVFLAVVVRLFTIGVTKKHSKSKLCEEHIKHNTIHSKC